MDTQPSLSATPSRLLTTVRAECLVWVMIMMMMIQLSSYDEALVSQYYYKVTSTIGKFM